MQLNKTKTFYFGLAIVYGLVWLSFIILLFAPKPTHYHANFAVYVRGERLALQESFYYQEQTSCGIGQQLLPQSRVHLHDSDPATIHVHDRAVTWNHFLNNLGFSVGSNSLELGGKLYAADQENELRLVLNGQILLAGIVNKPIGDQDVLLIDFGASDEATLLQRYAAIPKTAADYNQKQDPSGCGGGQNQNYFKSIKEMLWL